jgi:hypothetical protein
MTLVLTQDLFLMMISNAFLVDSLRLLMGLAHFELTLALLTAEAVPGIELNHGMLDWPCMPLTLSPYS